MASTEPSAAQYWSIAKKLMAQLSKRLDGIKSSDISKLDISILESVGKDLEKIRLTSIQTIFSDLTYASEQCVEEKLWKRHTDVNGAYRQLLTLLTKSVHAGTTRRVEKMYSQFLRVSLQFYKGYLQRLLACYDVPEINRVAAGMGLESTPSGEKITQMSQATSNTILQSCHDTFVRLGDLARYRIRAKPGKSSFETPLTYYSLAQDLLPDSGFAAHQIAIISLDEGNHLNVIYHFYRSGVVKNPHPHAKGNLEAEFKTLHQKRSYDQISSSPSDAFAYWFSKLHAFYYKGEPFSQQTELENEVLHRLEKSAVAQNTTKCLITMSLVNICAHHVATRAMLDSASEKTRRFRRFILDFNVRFITIFCKVLRAELQRPDREVTRSNDNPEESTQTSTIRFLVPILRLYCIWIASNADNVFALDGSVSIEPVNSMVEVLAEVFTLLFLLASNVDNISSCPYLLSEDIEILGLEPMAVNRVPQACQAFCSEDGKIKPHLSSDQSRLDQDHEMYARVLDILRCAYFFVEDARVKLNYEVTPKGLAFGVAGQEDTTPSENIPVIAPTDSTPDVPSNMSSRDKYQQGKMRLEKLNLSLYNNPQANGSGVIEDELTEHDMNAQNTVANMIAPFFENAAPQLHRQPTPGGNLPLHAAQSRTARDTFASSSTTTYSTPAVRSPTFEPLPWDWVHTPTQPKTSEHNDREYGNTNLTPPSQKGKYAVFPVPLAGPLGSLPMATSSSSIGSASSSTLRSSGKNLKGFPHPLGSPAFSISKDFQPHHTYDYTSSPIINPGSAGHNVSLNQFPVSTADSAFSQPDSLYHGTPARPKHQNNVVQASTRWNSDGPTPVQSNEAAAWHLQVNDLTTTYDGTVLNAAYWEQGSRMPDR